MSRRKPRPHRATAPASPCPCGLPASYADCCGTLHRGAAQAVDPEQLMRSRYSAFAVRDEAYLLRSWHSTTRPPRLDLDPGVRWVRLEIIASSGGSAFHNEGSVEFRAHCEEREEREEREKRGRASELHERSRFVRENGAWVYLDGLVTEQH